MKRYIKRENKRRKKMKLLKWIYNNDRLYFTLIGIVVVVSVMISITWQYGGKVMKPNNQLADEKINKLEGKLDNIVIILQNLLEITKQINEKIRKQ